MSLAEILSRFCQGKTIASLFAGKAPDRSQAPPGEPEAAMNNESQSAVDAETHVVTMDEGSQTAALGEPQVVVGGSSAVKDNEV
jgi:hypothetical protein